MSLISLRRSRRDTPSEAGREAGLGVTVPSARRRPVHLLVAAAVAVTTVVAGATWWLILRTADDSGTAAPTRVVAASADTYVNQGRPTMTYGDSTELRADASPALFRVYLHFDLGQLDETPSRAVLRLHTRVSNPSGLKVSAVSPSWSEEVTTYTTAPNPRGPAVRSEGAAVAGWQSIDVTRLLDDQATLDLAIVPKGEKMIVFDSREAGNEAQLVLTLPDRR
jgi:hypothetical protein